MRLVVRSVVRLVLVVGFGLAAWPVRAQVAMSGAVSGEVRAFPQSPGIAGQDLTSAQPTLTAEAKVDVAGLPKGFVATFNPYVRYDAIDSGRSVFDLHELNVSGGGRWWHLKAGYDVQFWGVMEFVNPVNILNQTDLTEDVFSKRKLGQPMVDYTLLGAFGTIDFYALTRFEPMQFPQSPGRLRPSIPIRQDNVTYSSGNGRSQVEGAVRYFRNIRNVYLGVSHFYGYQREPEMALDFSNGAVASLTPNYNLEHQTGLELQVTFGNMIVKSEDVVRFEPDTNRRSDAISVGGEYDLGAAMNARRTFTVFGEYYYDSREQSLIIPFRNDVFAGLRIGLNDRRSSEIRVWGNYDLTGRSGTAIVCDANARISDRVKAAVAYRGIVTDQQTFSSISRDSHVVLRLEVFF